MDHINHIRSLSLLCTFLLPVVGFCDPKSKELQAQIHQLQSQMSLLQQKYKSTLVERDQAQSTLKTTQVLLGQKPFNPKLLQTFNSSNKRSRSPLPKRRAKIRYVATESSDTQRINLGEIMQKSPVLLALWATWCKPCVSMKEQAHLRDLEQRLSVYGIPLLSIAIDDWSKVNRSRERWFYPLWHVKDAHLNLSPERLIREVGLGLPLFFLRLPDGTVPYYLAETLSTASVQEWVTVAVREKLQYTSFKP